MNDFTFLRNVDQSPLGIASTQGTNLTEVTATALQGAVILSMQGKVELEKANQPGWKAAQTNTLVSFGDRLRTGSRSRATLQLSDLSILRMNELTVIEIQPPRSTNESPSLRLTNGTINMFWRNRGSNEIQTPTSRIQIKG